MICECPKHGHYNSDATAPRCPRCDLGDDLPSWAPMAPPTRARDLREEFTVAALAERAARRALTAANGSSVMNKAQYGRALDDHAYAEAALNEAYDAYRALGGSAERKSK